MSQTPAKILYCEGNADGTVGGSYYCLLYLVKGLDRSRYDPVVVFQHEHSLLPEFHEAGVRTYIWPKPAPFTFGDNPSAWPGAARVLYVALGAIQKVLNFFRRFVFTALARAWFLRREGVRVVHLNNTIQYSHDWMVAARLARVKCVVHERGINASYSAAAKHFAKRLDAIICISNAVRRNMCERGVDYGNLVTIYDGMDPSARQFHTAPDVLRAAYGIQPGAPVVGMVGNIKEWKGQHTLIRAIDLVRRKFPSVRCVLVGDTGPEHQEYERGLRTMVASLGLDQHVIFTGYQKHVADHLRMFDVVVHASVLPEPFGMVALEAMACRKPLIGARSGAIPEIIQEGQTGLTFPPGDWTGLADAILTILGDPRMAESLGRNGFDRLVTTFHITKNVESVEGLYRRILCATA